MHQNIREAKRNLMQPISLHLLGALRYAWWLRNACRVCVLSYISANILDYINQSNRKHLTRAQKVTGSLFIARTELNWKGWRKKLKENHCWAVPSPLVVWWVTAGIGWKTTDLTMTGYDIGDLTLRDHKAGVDIDHSDHIQQAWTMTDHS